MGIIGGLVALAVAEAAVEAGTKAVAGVKSVAEKTKDVVNGASEKVSDALEAKDAIKQNMQLKKLDHYFYVEEDRHIGEGVYRVLNKKKKECYNTLLDKNGQSYTLHIYRSGEGKIATVKRIVDVVKTGVFSQDSISTGDVLWMGDKRVGTIIKGYENGVNTYLTDFNTWICRGDFSTNNYKIFDKATGKTIAVISKAKHKDSAFIIDCDDDENGPIVVIMALVIDLL